MAKHWERSSSRPPKGLLLPSRDFAHANLWQAQSSYTEDSSEAGDAVVSKSSRMELDPSGAQETGSTVQIQALRAGHPGHGEARFVYKTNTSPALEWFGCDVPTFIDASECVHWVPTGGINSLSDPHAATTAEGTVLLCAQVETGSDEVYVWRRDASSGAWGSPIAIYTTSGVGQPFHPCFILLPDERILLLHWVEDALAEEGQIRVHVSSDDGATWGVWQSYALEDAVSTKAASSGFNLGRIRGAHWAGQICVVTHLISQDVSGSTAYRDHLVQWASDDLSAELEEIDRQLGTSGTDAGGSPEVVVLGGVFVLGYLGPLDNRPYALIGGHAYVPFFDETPVDIDPSGEVWTTATSSGGWTLLDDGDLALCVADDGTGYAVGRQPTVGQMSILRRTWDGGATWVKLGTSDYVAGGSSSWYRSSIATSYLRHYAATWQRGRLVVASQFESISLTGSNEQSLLAHFLGGYSNLTHPGEKLFPTEERRVGYKYSGVPIDLPGALTIWTKTGSGTDALGAYVLGLTTSSQNLVYSWARTSGAPLTEPLLFMRAVKVVSHGGGAGAVIGFRLRMADATNGYELEVRIFATSFTVYDLNGATLLATVSSVPFNTGNGVQLKASMKQDKAAVWWRAYDTSEERAWNLAGTWTGLTDDSAAAGNQIRIQWGHLATATAQSDWFLWNHAEEEESGLGLAEGQANPSELFGRNFATRPIYVAKGVAIRAVDGPAGNGDEWTINATSPYSIRNFFGLDVPARSRVWRAEGTAQVQIATALAPGFTTAGHLTLLRPVLAYYGYANNWRTGALHRYTGTGWDHVTDLDLATTGRDSLPYVRDGLVVYPDSGTPHTGAHYIGRDELAGHTIDLGSGKLRTIRGNSPGVWRDDTGEKPELYLDPEGYDGTEPSSGTCSIWSPDVVVLIYPSGADEQATGLRLTIDAQSTVSGKIEGKGLFGEVLVFGMDYGHGRVIELESGVELLETPDRHIVPRELARARRRVDLAWQNIPTAHFRGQNPDPAYLLQTTTAGVRPSGSFPAVPPDLTGAVRTYQARPVVYLAWVPEGPPDVVSIIERRLFVHGFFDGTPREESISGEERAGELVRLAGVRLIEVVT